LNNLQLTTRPKIETCETELQTIRPITIGSSRYNGILKQHTLGYMEIDNVPYFAKSGSHSETDMGLIDGAFRTKQARAIFQRLGIDDEPGYFAHVESHLTALYVTRFM
jgi:hypothetical protein